MAAEEHLQPKQFMYHYSPVSNRGSIRQHGLKTSNPFDDSVHYSPDDAPEGVYMGPHARISPAAPRHGHDVWRVNTAGMETHHDPDDPDGSEYGDPYHYTPHNIPPERLSLAKGGHPGKGLGPKGSEVLKEASYRIKDM